MIFIYLVIFSFSLAYQVGDTVSDAHQNQEFDLCYSAPGNLNNTFSLGDYNGNTNGGDYNILVIDMSATWCGPCYSLIPLFDDLHQNYSNNEYVELFVALSDLDQPYSCNQWGNLGSSGIPNIIDDSGYPIYNMFGSGGFPSLVLIDHEMKVHHKESGYYSTFVADVSVMIDEMLSNMENSLILYTDHQIISNSTNNDGDGILNPGESFEINFTINNNSFNLDAPNVEATLNSVDGITFDTNTISFGNMQVGESSSFSVNGTINQNAEIKKYNLVLNINSNDYQTNYPFEMEVSLNQLGFPFDTNSEIKSNPAVLDFYGDGNSYVVFGDNSGLIHLLDSNGNSVENDFFPYDTGDQIWGSPAVSDIDNDGNLDVVFVSKSKHLYVFDLNGLKLDFNANQFLVGTPALGQLDDDNDLEIVFAGYSNDAKVFAINIDGTNVQGFPLLLDEKMMKGVALADFNSNGKDEIVVGTDDDNVYLINDDGSIGFVFQTDDKIRSAPIVVEYNGEKNIIVGSKDEKLYSIDSSGELVFSYDAFGSIYTSPTILDLGSESMIVFGDDEGYIYGLDLIGNLKTGFPINLNDGVPVSSIIFEDLDSDGLAEFIYGDELANLHILKSQDFTYSNLAYYNNMPLLNTFSYSSSAMTFDLDNDGDLEVICGTTGDLVIFDIKQNSSSSNYWNIYRGNLKRNGFHIIESQCSIGDLNSDSIINILDIVRLVNIVIDPLNTTEQELCAADLNSDNVINILDIVTLVNVVINE